MSGLDEKKHLRFEVVGAPSYEDFVGTPGSEGFVGAPQMWYQRFEGFVLRGKQSNEQTK